MSHTPTTTDILTADDHARGCAGREYACTCGYDERVADEIRLLRARVAELAKEVEELEIKRDESYQEGISDGWERGYEEGRE